MSVPLNWDVQVRHVMQDEVDKVFIAFFSDKLDSSKINLKFQALISPIITASGPSGDWNCHMLSFGNSLQLSL